jgi:hypothetical protein
MSSGERLVSLISLSPQARGHLILVLQLHFSADPSSVMALARDGLVGPTPRRPCENEGAWNDIGQQQAYDQGADLRDGERDERATVCVGLLLFRLP